MAIPERIGKYEISEQIGVGGFGAVYKARDPFIKRTVAVKTCSLNDEEIRNRFFREAELAGNLHHRNITTIYDFGLENGIPYIVQEFLSGEDLDRLIKRREALSVTRKVEILMAITDGLGYAHRASVIHRDIKPSNIRILEDGTVKVMDFGIAKSLLSESSLTQTGITLGTSAYLAPEQIRGEPLDQRTDVFALGILAYELLTFRKPFRGEHLSTVLYKILNESPDPVREVAPEVPLSLSSVVARAMEKEIERRYPSMEAMRLDLQGVYREIAGVSARFATVPRATEATRSPASPTAAIDPDQTIATPARGVSVRQVGHITPPSGALARVPARTSASAAAPPRATKGPGLELVDFRDPSQKPVAAQPSEPERRAPTGRSSLAIGVAVLAVVGVTAALILFARGRSPAPAPRAAVRPLPTAPLAFPTPQLGQVPAASARQALATAAPTPAAVAEKPEAVRPVRRYKVQISSLPMSTLSVDGRTIGPSIPARTLELPEGEHTARFEHPEFPPAERKFVARAGAAPIVYRFPVGYLVIRAPSWTGANILIDMKFKGVLAGEQTFPLKSGAHKITLSREGVMPLTAEVTVPEGDKKTWTPPAPSAQGESSS